MISSSQSCCPQTRLAWQLVVFLSLSMSRPGLLEYLLQNHEHEESVHQIVRNAEAVRNGLVTLFDTLRYVNKTMVNDSRTKERQCEKNKQVSLFWIFAPSNQKWS